GRPGCTPRAHNRVSSVQLPSLLCRCRRRERQAHDDSGPDPKPAFDEDGAAARPGKALDHWQAEPAQTVAFGREEGVEGAHDGFGRHADTAVDDPDVDQCPIVAPSLDMELDLPAPAHRLARIEDEIEDRALEAEWIAGNVRQVRVDPDVEADVVLQRAAER